MRAKPVALPSVWLVIVDDNLGNLEPLTTGPRAAKPGDFAATDPEDGFGECTKMRPRLNIVNINSLGPSSTELMSGARNLCETAN